MTESRNADRIQLAGWLANFGAEDCREGSRSVGHDGIDRNDWEDYIEVPVGALVKMRAALLAAQPSQAQAAEACWSCGKPYTAEQRLAADGHCPHCDVEIHIEAAPASPVASEREGLTYPAEFTDDLQWILGLMCFQCIQYAQALRKGGREIPSKAEAEQAATLDFLLRRYMRDPDNWRKTAADELREMAATRTGSDK